MLAPRSSGLPEREKVGYGKVDQVHNKGSNHLFDSTFSKQSCGWMSEHHDDVMVMMIILAYFLSLQQSNNVEYATTK